MPWNTITPMEEINRFVSLAASGRFTRTELCADFKVSRKTGHKWLCRYAAEGVRGLAPRSHRTRHCPHQTAVKIERLVLKERRWHRTWGPKKLQELLRCRHRIKPLPACSTLLASRAGPQSGGTGSASDPAASPASMRWLAPP